VISANGLRGIEVNTVTGTLIEGNYIGTDFSGAFALGNASGGVVLAFTTGANTVGGTTAAARNVISGNATAGVYVFQSTGNLVEGNYLGLNAAGTGPLANAVGVLIDSTSTNNTVGGTAAGATNLISGNTGAGVAVIASSTRNAIEGNSIVGNGGL